MRAYLHVLTGCQGRASCSCDNYSDRTVKSLSLFLPLFLRRGSSSTNPASSFPLLHSTYLPLIKFNLLDPALHPHKLEPRALVNPQIETPLYPLHIQRFGVVSQVDTKILISENKKNKSGVADT